MKSHIINSVFMTMHAIGTAKDTTMITNLTKLGQLLELSSMITNSSGHSSVQYGPWQAAVYRFLSSERYHSETASCMVTRFDEEFAARGLPDHRPLLI